MRNRPDWNLDKIKIYRKQNIKAVWNISLIFNFLYYKINLLMLLSRTNSKKWKTRNVKDKQIQRIKPVLSLLRKVSVECSDSTKILLTYIKVAYKIIRNK